MAEPRLPLVTSCEGGTPLAQLAGEVAQALEQLGVAEVACGVGAVVSAARAGRGVIVLDGCASGCRSRLLEARGLRPAALELGQLGVSAQTVSEANPETLAVRAAERLRSSASSGRRGRPRRPAGLAAASWTKRAHTVDDYLLAIDALASATVDCGAISGDAPTLAAHVSGLLGVTRASAGQMLARLEDAGLVERSAREKLLLTGDGRAAADRALRRHRLLEIFVSDVLGYPPGAWYEQARILDGAFDEAAIDRLRQALHDPDRCPHGWPIDAVRGREESRGLTVLTALADGERAGVVCVAEQDGRLVEELYALGLTPAAELRVERRGPAGGGMTVQVGGVVRSVDAGRQVRSSSGGDPRRASGLENTRTRCKVTQPAVVRLT